MMIRMQHYSLERLEPLGKMDPSSSKIHFTAAYLCEKKEVGCTFQMKNSVLRSNDAEKDFRLQQKITRL